MEAGADSIAAEMSEEVQVNWRRVIVSNTQNSVYNLLPYLSN